MVQAKAAASPNPSPSSSTSSRSRPTSIAAHPPAIVPLEPEELEDNRFYRYIRSHFNLIFSRSTVVCVPHSRSLEGLILTKDFIETHCYNTSPYYKEQYQAANGKVIAIEIPLLSTVSGFKEPRTLHVMAEELVYIGRKKIRVLMIERPLEGEAPVWLHPVPNTISIPTARNSKTDLDFLNMFPENAEAMHELQLTVQKFVDTYVYIRGFNAYTVEKIQHMYIKTYKTILQRNKLLRDACRLQTEHDHFLELVENVVMGFLHEKIWVQSLRSILHSQDNYLDSICRAYARETITLNRYAVSHPMANMSLECFEAAIVCLRRVDTDIAPPISVSIDEERPSGPFPAASDQLAFTPLEKLTCIRTVLDLITEAVSTYIKSTSVNMVPDGN
ncbi:hypothetical protein BDB00DRAFT_752895 [Zychaea mexicana]|uniref:uncharacterized protein n=1 Tax=Zychaea mexicana TaxID=64656 RepID=UPI0022FDD79A|nr:uncharacterized protein BDB00DRAFT_752895 [Zychaea mexicana]KAI9499449.1 hypothetical protein BDB00DRAFT_752895 [Zychaea mexicana]